MATTTIHSLALNTSVIRKTRGIVYTFVCTLVGGLLLTGPASAGFLTGVQQKTNGYLIAEADLDDSYDPFSDYSEFDEASDEEADIHFFRNGRFFTIGLTLGLRNFTDQLTSLYSSGASYGIFLSYFFDLNLALQFGFLTGSHDLSLGFNDSNGNPYTNTGNVSLTFINFDLKYYFNTQNVTKGLADLNPYLIGGFCQVARNYSYSGVDGMASETVPGVNIGLGLEIPLLKRKSFFGIQGVYHYINFKDKNTPMIGIDGGGNQIQTNVKPRGATYDLLGIFGFNF